MTENVGENQQENYEGYSVDDEDQLQQEDSLVDRNVEDKLDEGYTAPEKWSPAEGYGNTQLEEELGETLDQRLRQEEPEPDPYQEAAEETEHVGGEVGDARAGRLVAEDVGIDGAAASAEEAAVHVVDEED
jgi:hypothetical protein